MKDLSKRRAAMEERLQELDSRLHGIEDALEEPAPKDWEDRAVERESDEVLEGLGQAGQAEIAMIKAALARMDDGSYGICVRCGDEISPERLDVVPFTPLCRDCAKGAG